jgi:hypothetical protein
MMTSSFNFKGTKSPNILKILETADIHLGHQRTPSESTLEALDRVINPKTLKDLDVLLIAGDFFDHLLQFPDDRVLKIEAWVCQLLLLCKKFDVVLRVLEGTGSHDCKQSRIFVNLNSSAAINADVKYVDKISVEVIERFGISVLYVPDNQGHNDTVWFDAVASTGIMQNYDLSVSNGTEKGNYFFSLGYLKNDGIIKNSEFDRLSARVNTSYKLFNDIVTIGENFTK